MAVRILALLLASLSMIAVAPNALAENQSEAANCEESQGQCINAWFDDKFEESLAFSPMRMTTLGRRTDYDKIDDFSLQAEDEQLQWWRDALAEMKARWDFNTLSADEKVSWRMFEFRTAEREASVQNRGSLYLLNQQDGMHQWLPTFLMSQHPVENEADMRAYISRISAIGAGLDQVMERVKLNAQNGVRPPRYAYESVIEVSNRLTTGAPFGEGEPSAVWKSANDHIDRLLTEGSIDAATAEALRADARSALLTGFGPAYNRIAEWFAADMPNSDEQARGVSALPGGADYYQYSLTSYNTTDMTPDAIHRLGLAEVARIRGEMEAIKDAVGFEGDLKAFFTFLREDDRFYFSQDDAGAQDYLDAAEKYLDFINERLPDFFGILPKADLVVKRVEPFRERDGAAQHYREGTPDGSRPGTYYAHLSDMRAMPKTTLEVIAYHEGNPGHHMQVSIAQELEGVPKFRAQGDYISAFSEGWGLYSEYLAKEMGAYQDPYSDFGRLTTEMWRAIRLVVDTGIHSKGWSEDQAADYFRQNSPIPDASILAEVRRYTVRPGQATAYKIGMIRIQELRARAEAELGDDFDIRAFHDTVLGGGEVPLSLLEVQVENWIASVDGS